MKRREISALDLMEESGRVLSGLPASAIAVNFIGTMPFVLCFLFFWYDMSHGAFAQEHIGVGSLALALLFVWMNVWQSLFAARVRRALDGDTRPPAYRRLFALQSIVQPTCLLAIPIAALITLPFAAVCAFYQNLNCIELQAGLADSCRKAARAAAMAPRQCWILLGLISILGCVLFVNLAVGIFFAAKLIDSFFGIQSVFTRSPAAAVVNTTYLAIVAGFTYLLLDPLVKTAYTLRCFYSESLTSGADLRIALRRLHAVPAILVLFLLAPLSLKSQPAVPTEQLDHAIDQVIHRPQYSWRLSRQSAAPESESTAERFARSIIEGFGRFFRLLARLYEGLSDWVREMFRRPAQLDASGGAPRRAALRLAATGICVLLAVAAGVMAWRLWGRTRRSPAVESQAVANAIDVEDESLAAEQIPEEEWLRMGRDCFAQGDYRQGVRAFYLAALANLGRRELIRLAKSKTNREYERELSRRARGVPHVIPAFAESARIYERTWYGDHRADGMTREQLNANIARMRADA